MADDVGYYPSGILGPSTEEILRARLADPYAGGGLISARPLTMRERLGNLLGLSETREDVRNAEMAGRVLDLLPFSGGLLATADATDAADRGDYLGASLLAGSSALGAIPVVGGMARRAGKPIKGLFEAGTPSAGRGIINTPDLRNMTQDDAISAARSEPHLIKDKSGQYVGAPRGFTTKKQIDDMREHFDFEVAAGLTGGNWYNRARAFNEEIAGGSPYRQKLAAAEEALWSAQSTPDTNMGFVQQGHNAYEAGLPLDKVRTTAQASNYNRARRDYDSAMGHNGGPPLDGDPTGLPSLGKKTSVYGQHLDPTRPFATTGTNDIWHARQFGYTNADGGLFSRALTAQEHRFLDYETMLAVDRANARKLGGRDDWTAAEIQAAPWVAGKGRAEAQRRGLTEQEGIDLASKTYPDYAAKYTAYSTSEQVPGKSAGLLGNVHASDYPAKEAFTAEAPWLDKAGRDPIYSDMNMWTRRSDQGPGYYINSEGVAESNPVAVGKPLISFEKDKKTGAVNVSDFDKAAMNAGEAVRGLLDAQEGSAWNKVITQATSGADRTSLDVNVGRMLTRSELEAVNKVASKHGYGMANTENGVALLDFTDGKLTYASVGKMLKGDLGKELKAVLPDATVKRGRLASGYIDQANNFSAEKAGQGLATEEMLKWLGELKEKAPGYYEKLLDSEGVAAKARANLDRLYKYGGKGQREDYEELLKIVGEKKLRGLVDRVTSFGTRGLPAIGAVSASGGLLDTGDDSRSD